MNAWGRLRFVTLLAGFDRWNPNKFTILRLSGWSGPGRMRFVTLADSDRWLSNKFTSCEARPCSVQCHHSIAACGFCGVHGLIGAVECVVERLETRHHGYADADVWVQTAAFDIEGPRH